MSQETIIEASVFARETSNLGTVAEDYNGVQDTYQGLGSDTWGTLTELNQFGPCVSDVQALIANQIASVRRELEGLLGNIRQTGVGFQNTESESVEQLTEALDGLEEIETDLRQRGTEFDESVQDFQTEAQEQAREQYETEDRGYADDPRVANPDAPVGDPNAAGDTSAPTSEQPANGGSEAEQGTSTGQDSEPN